MTNPSDIPDDIANALQKLADSGDVGEENLSALLAEIRAERAKIKTPEEIAENVRRQDLSDAAMLAFRAHVKKVVADRSITIEDFGGHTFAEHYAARVRMLDAENQYRTVEEREQRIISFFTGNASLWFIKPDDAERIHAAIRGEDVYAFDAGHDCQCGDCAMRLGIAFCGSKFVIGSTTPCEKNATFSFEIDFPTGEVIFADWPDRFSEATSSAILIEPKHGSINYLKGQREATEGYAKLDIVHVSVGNSSPSLYVSEDGTRMQCGSEGYDEERDDHIRPEGMKDVGYFCTDLWWTTMLDKKHYDAIIAKLPEKRSNEYYEKDNGVAKIEPGRYRFTVLDRYANAANSDEEYFDGEGAYWVAERIGPCQVEDREWGIGDSQQFMTPGQYAASSSYLSGRGRYFLLDYVFNCIGNGLRSKGEFLSAIMLTEPVTENEGFATDVNMKGSPYPNFSTRYGLIVGDGGDETLKALPDSWLNDGAWYYERSLKYFQKEEFREPGRAYHTAYIGDGKNNDEFLKRFEDFRKPGMTEDEYHAAVSKAYEFPYDGDIEKFRHGKWAKEKAEIMQNIRNILDRMYAEMERRDG